MIFIVALGNGLNNQKELTIESKITALFASILLKQKIGQKIIFSGGFTKGKESKSEASKMYEFVLNYIQIPQNDIYLEENSIDTAGNASEVKKYLDKNSTVYLVSFGYHLKRAKRLFENYGIKVSGIFASEKILSKSLLVHKKLVKEFGFKRKAIKLIKEIIFLTLVYSIDSKGKILRIISSRTRG
jgi:uncharacterized SAM-binding protein YcdF (DUF218 family)